MRRVGSRGLRAHDWEFAVFKLRTFDPVAMAVMGFGILAIAVVALLF